MKYITCSSETHIGLEMRVVCPTCSNGCGEPHCPSCLTPVLQCVICHTSVKGNFISFLYIQINSTQLLIVLSLLKTEKVIIIFNCYKNTRD